MKNKRLWILLGGIALIGLAFLLINFRVAVSNTQAEKLTVTMGDKVAAPMQQNGKIKVVLVGEGPLVPALQKALTAKMNEAGFGEIELVQELEPMYQNPVLVVKVGKPGPIWTPLFALSQFSIYAGYASNGDVTFMESIEETHTSIASKDPAVLDIYAEYDVNDRSFGLISRPGYHQFLANYLAQEIITALKDL